jgi:hypothetical protein
VPVVIVPMFVLILAFLLIFILVPLRGRTLKRKRLQQRAIADEYIAGLKQPVVAEINSLIDELVGLNQSMIGRAEEDQFRIEKLRELRNRIPNSTPII